MKHTQPVTIAFDEGDPEKILFFGRFFHHSHRVVEGFVRESGIGWDTWFNHSDWGAPLRHAESDFKKPMMAGGIYQAELEILNIGDSSVQIKVQFMDKEELLATVVTTHVFVDKKKMQKRTIPDEIREKLESFKNS